MYFNLKNDWYNSYSVTFTMFAAKIDMCTLQNGNTKMSAFKKFPCKNNQLGSTNTIVW